MNATNVNAVPDFAHSVGVAVAVVKSLREAGNGQDVIRGAIKHHLQDEKLFVKAQRPQALKQINRQCGTSFTMSQINKASTVAYQPESETQAPQGKGIPVDELHGAVDIPAAKPNLEQQQELLEDANKGVEIKPIPEEYLRDETPNNTESPITPNSEPAAAARLEDNANQELTQENTTMANVNTNTATETNTAEAAAEVKPPVTLAAVIKHGRGSEEIRARLADAGIEIAPHHAALKVKLDSINVATDEQFEALVNEFFAAHPDHIRVYKGIASLGGSESEQDRFANFLLADPLAAAAFDTLVNTKAAASQPAEVTKVEESFTERALRSMRGKRETGFSSGVVAAASAVVGGGIEMAFRGGLTLGSTIGATVGAVGAYFAAEAAEGLMESETGRYIVSSSIGLVAGGAGSSLGRTVQGALQADSFADVVASVIPGANKVEAPAAVVPATVATEGFGSMFGLA